MTDKNENNNLINKAARDILTLARSLLIVRLRFLDIPHAQDVESVQVGPLYGYISLQPRKSIEGPTGMRNMARRKHTIIFQAGASLAIRKPSAPRKNSSNPMKVPISAIGCRRARRRLKKPPRVILSQRSS